MAINKEIRSTIVIYSNDYHTLILAFEAVIICSKRLIFKRKFVGLVVIQSKG